jgi:hypothetical protein
MYWSYSSSKVFRRCQRQWFYHERYANALTKDLDRRYAFSLKKLTTVSQWRGQLVDTVLSNTLIPSLATNQPASLGDLKREAVRLFDLQLACARAHPIRDRQFRPRDAGDSFAAFYRMEYEGRIDEAEIETARREVAEALDNLFKMDVLRARIRNAHFRATQRMIRMTYAGMTVKGVPDLVLYAGAEPPTIIDWKVHALGERDAWNQLGIYSILLAQSRGAMAPREKQPLLEVQLLQGEIREHVLGEPDFEQLEDYMAGSVEEMLLALAGDADGDETVADPRVFAPARSAETCQQCAFRRICWTSALIPTPHDA